MGTPATAPFIPRDNGKPIIRARRQIEECTYLDPETRSHVLQWLEQIRDQVGDDPKQQALAASACIAYTNACHLNSKCLAVKPESKGAVALTNQWIRWQTQVQKCLRMAALPRGGKKDSGKPGQGNVFTPPRPRSTTELQDAAISTD